MTNGNEPMHMATSESGYVGQYSGLTKREYFAAMRKEPLFGDDSLSKTWAELIMGSQMPEASSIANIQWWAEAIEKFSLMRADALIKALNEQP